MKLHRLSFVFAPIEQSILDAYARTLREELEDANKTQRQPKIGLLGGGNSMKYFCTQLALTKLGVRVLLLAESNPTNALHHLLDNCDFSVVITDSKNAKVRMQQVHKIEMIESLPKAATTSSAELDSIRFQDLGIFGSVIHSFEQLYRLTQVYNTY